VNNADARDVRGLAVTGVGTVDCARHNMKRPNSMGDLQLGEKYVINILGYTVTYYIRYINMDFFFFSGLKKTAIKSIVVSYDIACQWCKKFWTRMEAAFPDTWRINKSEVDIRFLVPKFHLPAHIESCHRSFSFNYSRFVGRTDGEAPERGWADLNGLAYSTREMGPGSRQDTIEDHLGDWNWKKITTMGKIHL
jgi:Kyakuja-Dileera-Zisupton transposase